MTSADSKLFFEEKLNTYSHGLGILLSVIGAYIILNKVNSYLWTSVFMYSVSLILLFTASTLYHATFNTLRKKKLRILDHISIYYLIAGTYTPVCLSLLKDSKGLFLLWLIWGIAGFGTLLKLLFTGKFAIFSLALYGIMGWLVIIDIKYLFANATNTQLIYLSLGGFFYTLGILFYANEKIPHNHFIWHLLVLGGAISHWLFIYKIVVI